MLDHQTTKQGAGIAEAYEGRCSGASWGLQLQLGTCEPLTCRRISQISRVVTICCPPLAGAMEQASAATGGPVQQSLPRSHTAFAHVVMFMGYCFLGWVVLCKLGQAWCHQPLPSGFQASAAHSVAAVLVAYLLGRRGERQLGRERCADFACSALQSSREHVQLKLSLQFYVGCVRAGAVAHTWLAGMHARWLHAHLECCTLADAHDLDLACK